MEAGCSAADDGDAEAGPGAVSGGLGSSRSTTTYATTTATMTIGMTVSPSDSSRMVARRTDTMGSLSMTADMAPMPIAAPATIANPGHSLLPGEFMDVRCTSPIAPRRCWWTSAAKTSRYDP